MANPRQRRKARSSSHKPVKHSRRANKLLKKQPPIHGPKVLQEAWDKRKTVRQNYAALGLAHTLIPTDPGGRIVTHAPMRTAEERENADTRPKLDDVGAPMKVEQSCGRSSSNGQTKDGKLPRGFGRIIRDETGAVVDVLLAEEAEETIGGEKAEDDAEMDDIEIGRERRQPEKVDIPAGSGWLLEDKAQEEDVEREGAKGVLRALEAASKAENGRRARSASEGEMKYLTRLVEEYGADYEGMARDRKNNVNQYTAGQLRRAIERAKVTPRAGC